MSGYDRVTYCDVVECCEMCPMYGYDCDGDKRAETPTTDEKHQLSAETPTDLISRADAIEAVCGVVIDEFDVSPTRGYEVAEKALSALPSAEAVQGWIPCSERLPSESDYYLVTNINAFEEKEVCVIWFAHKADYGVSEWREITDGDIVLAWMPLPKPYKGGDDE